MRIKVNPFFILFLFICGYIGFIEEAVIIFLSVILHELGHAIAAKKVEVRVDEIELFPFGGVAKMEDISKFGGYTEAFIAIAGPLVSLFLYVICLILSSFSISTILLTKYNFALFAFNILPALPLDGGRIIRNLLLFYLSYKQSTRIMVFSGQILAMSIVALNIKELMNGSNSIALMITGIFIFLGTLKEKKYCSYMYLLNKNNRKQRSIKNRNIHIRTINVSKKTFINQIASSFSPVSLCKINVMDGSGRIIKVLNEADIMDGLLKYGYDATVGDILK